MKIDYASRVLAQMATAFSTEELLRIEDLATREAVSSSYLVQILNDLKQAGLVVSRRGKDGGYALSREPDSITLYDIIKAVEGEVLEFGCAPSGDSGIRVHDVWAEIRASLVDKYTSYTLKSLSETEAEPMYYI